MQVYLKRHIVVHVCTLNFFVDFASTDENPFMPKFHQILITLVFWCEHFPKEWKVFNFNYPKSLVELFSC